MLAHEINWPTTKLSILPNDKLHFNMGNITANFSANVDLKAIFKFHK